MSLSTKVLITGGAGFIGSNLADGLIKQGAKVTIIDSLITGFRENLEEIAGDFDFVSPKTSIHFAYGDDDEFYSVKQFEEKAQELRQIFPNLVSHSFQGKHELKKELLEQL